MFIYKLSTCEFKSRCSHENTCFGEICPKRSNFSVEDETWCLHLFKCPEFSGDVHFPYFGPKLTFLSKFGPKRQNSIFKMTIGFYRNSNMSNSMVTFKFSLLNRNYTFWLNLVRKETIVWLTWNLVPRLIQICRIQC